MSMSRNIRYYLLVLLIAASGCARQPTVTPVAATCPPELDCSGPQLTLTAQAYSPMPGDLGWGEVRGQVTDTLDGSPIPGAQVFCRHRSNHPVSLCQGSLTTGADGRFVFPHVFFQNTDIIEVAASESMHAAQMISQAFFTRPGLYVTLVLPVVDPSPRPCCTAPACRENEVYTCKGVCPCGCGTTCATKTPTPTLPGAISQPDTPTYTPSATPTPITFSCVECADPRNALVYFCPLAMGGDEAAQMLASYGEIRTGEVRGHACVYAYHPDLYLSYIYYVDAATGNVVLAVINPSLLPTDTTTPDGT
jgi:hypothetical protein